jgi:hypothetical protein
MTLPAPWRILHAGHPWLTDPDALRREALYCQNVARWTLQPGNGYESLHERNPIAAQQIAAREYANARYFTGLWMEASR